jgi:hypothetical protein
VNHLGAVLKGDKQKEVDITKIVADAIGEKKFTEDAIQKIKDIASGAEAEARISDAKDAI